MRVLIGSVSYHPYVSGVSVFAQSLAQFLTAAGDDVSVVGPATRGRIYPKKRTTEYGVHVIRVSSLANPFRPGFRMPFIRPDTARSLVESVQPDIVHVQDPLPANWLLLRAAHRRGIRVIGTNHVQISLLLAYVPAWSHWFIRKFLGRYLAWFYNQCDAITVPSNVMKTAMRGYGVRQPIHVISNGIDLARFQPKESATKSLNSRMLAITVGRVDKDKSVDVVIRAVGALAETNAVELVVIGGGEELAELKELVHQNHWESVIRFTGSIPHDSPELVEWYQRSDCFVTASTIEAQGIVALEAMAAGKPIVAANAGGLPELVTPNVNGFLVAPNNVTDVTNAIRKLASDPALREQFGAESRRLAAAHDSQAMLGKFRSLYQTMKATT